MDATATVPAGRYAVVDPADGKLKFYQVDTPTQGKWAGWVFLSVFASDEKFPIRDRSKKEIILGTIGLNPKEAMMRYGLELGICGRCGRALTDETSRALGIGPICLAQGF